MSRNHERFMTQLDYLAYNTMRFQNALLVFNADRR